MIGISDKQGEMLAFIENFVVQHGFPPTREEIRAGLNISTKSLVNYHLEALENAALLTRIPNTPRGLRLNGENNHKEKIFLDSTPEFPILNHNQVVELTFDMVTNNRNLYALKIEDDKMVNAQVDEGDIVILQRQSCAENGEMVAVRLLDQNETMLKQYYRENGHVRLQPANSKLDSMIVAPEAVQIQGKVIAIIRQVD